MTKNVFLYEEPLRIIIFSILEKNTLQFRPLAGYPQIRDAILQEVIMENTLKEQKKALRVDINRRIAALDPAYAARADEAIARYIFSLPEYQQAGTVFCFVSMDSEINTRPILDRILADGKTLAVPLCLRNREMQARKISRFEELTPGFYGILEPAADTPCVSPEDISLAIIPCVSCSHTGIRLGHGGGYYDIYFSRADIPSVMICREQITCEEIPLEVHDLRFPLVITEEGIFRNGL